MVYGCVSPRFAPRTPPMTAALLPLALLGAAAVPDAAPASGAPAVSAAAKFTPFSLADQFGASHAVAGRPGEVVALIYGDREAAEASRELGTAVHVLFHPAAAGRTANEAATAPVRPVGGAPAGSAAPAVRVVPAACAPGVPGPIRSVVAFKLRRAAPDTPVWLDWNGRFAARFGLSAGVPNAVVLAPAGTARRVIVAGEGVSTAAAAARVGHAVEAVRRGIVAGN